MQKILRKFKFLHYIGFHNKNCRRRLFTTKNTYSKYKDAKPMYTDKELLKILEKNYERSINHS